MSSKTQDVVKRKNPLRSTARKMLVAAGFTRKDRHMVDYVVGRMNNDLRDLSIRSYLNSTKRVKPAAVHTAAKQMNLGEYKIMRDLFKRRTRRVQKKELEA